MSTPSPFTLDDLAWLAGDWRGEPPHETLEQHYTTVAGGTLLATSRLTHDGQSPHREMLLFEQGGDGRLRLTVVHPGQGEDVYEAAGTGDDGFVFACDPSGRRIALRRLGASRLAIRFEKEGEGGTRAFAFTLAR
ncbi:MAG: hypothetical protein EB084_23845 [Proteobacteria bacterium]|nr:hypothetical protein [Pseudomonadota bacterium]